MPKKQPTTCALFFILSLSLHTQAQLDVRLPPSIVDGPPTDYLFQSSADVPLTCTAVGSAELSYVWRKNGINIDCTTSTRYLCIGNKIVRIESAAADDEGYYQCFVSNNFGSTMSNVMRLRMITAGSSDSRIEHPSVAINQGVSLACNAPATVPTMEEKAQNADATTPEIQWGIARGGPDDNNLVPVETSARVHIHGSWGDLYFSNYDTYSRTFYKCQTRVGDAVVFTGYHNVSVVGSESNFPVYSISTNKIPAVGLERQSVVFQCIFQGRPTPQLNASSWQKVGGSLPSGRYSLSDFSTKLRISNLQQSDAGQYTCEPVKTPEAIKTMSLTIEAAPEFLTEEDRPHNINASDGDTVTINCSAYAIPTASILWYRNGQQLAPDALPAKYQLSADQTQLIISNVCKDCGGGMSDLASIQCNASNKHGHNFVQGYLNVLKRTSITSPPVNERAAQKLYVLDCVATTDDSTTLTTAWYIWGLVVRPDPVISICDNGTLLIDMRMLTEVEFSPYCGTYTCLAANGFSTDTIKSTIECEVIGQQPLISVTATNSLNFLYVDGVLLQPLPNFNNWQEIDILPVEQYARLVAIRAINIIGGCSGLMVAITEHPTGYEFLSNDQWLCSASPAAGWEHLGYDDSTWTPAFQVGRNGVTGSCPWIPLTSMPDNAFWIWTPAHTDGDTIVTCRGYTPICDHAPCQNGGTCNRNAPQLCSCPVRWEGRFCELDVTDCASQPCQNGGTCIFEVEGGYHCDCVPGFNGPNCQNKQTGQISLTATNYINFVYVDNARKFPLPNAADWQTVDTLPIDTYSRLVAVRATNIVGNCSGLLVAISDHPTSYSFVSDNKWVCSDNPASGWEYLGFDDSTWTPAYQVGRNGGIPDGCLWSTISDIPESAYWIWTSNHTNGDNVVSCRGYTPICDYSPCLNGATCNRNTCNLCSCSERWGGQFCEIDVSDCGSNPCQNGGTCNFGVNGGYHCDCEPGYSGSNCEIDIKVCDSSPCQNGGSCIFDVAGGYRCACVPGFSGFSCEIDLKVCDSNPCQNGGTCIIKVDGGYYCDFCTRT